MNNTNQNDNILLKCGGCGNENPHELKLVFDKKKNRGYLCNSCFKKYKKFLEPDSIRNYWMCGNCNFRILAGTDMDLKVDDLDNKCPNCRKDLTDILINLKNDKVIDSGIFGEPLE